MPAFAFLQKRSRDTENAALITTVVIVLFLFFIDEGYYDFRWMKEWGNWLVFFIYLLIVFPIMWLIAQFTFPKVTGWRKVISVMGLGFALALVSVFGFFS